jgi:hypothetical protein
MATPTYAELLATAKQGLSKILSGVAVEWSEGGHRVRVADPDKMLAIIERLESLAGEEAGGSPMRPIVTVNL